MDRLRLTKLEGHSPVPGPVVCVIMDGVGLGKRDASDGVHLARTPVLDALVDGPLSTTLKAHGTSVGMPSDSDMGNSEVGHNTLGSGRVYAQGAKLVAEAIASRRLFDGAVWKEAVARGLEGHTLHFIGLLSDGNVHSHIDHLFALLDECARAGVERVRVHTLLDGRDVAPKSALDYLAPTERKLTELSAGGRDYRIASGGGRMVTTMDRYGADWSVVERGWSAHVLGMGRAFESATQAVETYYAEDPSLGDQYMDSFVIADENGPVGTIEEGDAVIVYNFRGDRSIELSEAFEQDDFSHFDRRRRPDVFYAGMMQYDGDTQTPKRFLVEPPQIEGTLSEYLCAMGLRSFAVSETQKYGHVTYFWNGNNSGYVDESLEKYVEVPSDNVPFDQRPRMKAVEITDETIAAVKSGDYDFIRLNYPNGDMVGHTGVPEAIITAVETVDSELGRLLHEVEGAKGAAIVLADHGNADLMFIERDGLRSPHVAHTLNPVPCVIRDFSGVNRWRLVSPETIPTPGLSHIAATLCFLLGYEKPPPYDPSLIALGAR